MDLRVRVVLGCSVLVAFGFARVVSESRVQSTRTSRNGDPTRGRVRTATARAKHESWMRAFKRGPRTRTRITIGISIRDRADR